MAGELVCERVTAALARVIGSDLTVNTGGEFVEGPAGTGTRAPILWRGCIPPETLARGFHACLKYATEAAKTDA